ncbi:hypothetical protein ACQPZQ_24615 [Pseudonocardia sp. CA-142604]|uniref:hypothetical protein n=1 Tax=Pseudonocardia sp. CA-142604 TaxID=3240024 RepID=UPI003D8C9A0D
MAGEPSGAPGQRPRLRAPVAARRPAEAVVRVLAQQPVDPARVDLVEALPGAIEQGARGHERAGIGEVLGRARRDVGGDRGADRAGPLRGGAMPEGEALGVEPAGDSEAVRQPRVVEQRRDDAQLLVRPGPVEATRASPYR